MPVTRLDPGAAATTLDSPRRLSLTFAEPRPVQEVLQLLLAGTPFSLAVDPDVTGTFRGELKQLTLRDALLTVLTPVGSTFELQGTVLRVTHGRGETREFDVNLLAAQRSLSRASGTAAATLSTTVAGEDVFAGISDGVQSLLSPSGKVHVDRRAGLVQVTDDPERLDRVGLYLEALQVRSGRQVRLQARVLEVTLKNAPAIDWRAVRDRLGLPADAPDAGLTTDLAALQSALAFQGDIRVISAPEVTALNNEPTLMRATIPGVSALTLTVVPQISADGIVQLSVSHSWEEQAPDEKDARVSQADTVTRVMNGRTVLIAGLLRPSQIAMAAELVVLLRPTVVTPGTR